MKSFKKVLAAALSAVMLVSSMAIPSFAAPSPEAAKLENGTITVSASSFTYNGKAQGPTVTVKAKDGTVLKADTDYKLTGATATNAGDYTVTAEGIAPYTGKLTATYKINPAELTSVSLKTKSVTWTGSSLKTKIKVKEVKAGDLVVPADGYTLTLPKTVKNSGKYTVKVTGKGNFTGSATATFTVKPKTKKAKAIKATAKANKTTIKNTKKQTVKITVKISPSGAKKAPVTVKFAGKSSLKKYVTIDGKTITFKKKAKKGKYKFTVKVGAYNNYKASKKMTVTITVK